MSTFNVTECLSQMGYQCADLRREVETDKAGDTLEARFGCISKIIGTITGQADQLLKAREAGQWQKEIKEISAKIDAFKGICKAPLDLKNVKNLTKAVGEISSRVEAIKLKARDVFRSGNLAPPSSPVDESIGLSDIMVNMSAGDPAAFVAAPLAAAVRPIPLDAASVVAQNINRQLLAILQMIGKDRDEARNKIEALRKLDDVLATLCQKVCDEDSDFDTQNTQSELVSAIRMIDGLFSASPKPEELPALVQVIDDHINRLIAFGNSQTKHPVIQSMPHKVVAAEADEKDDENEGMVQVARQMINAKQMEDLSPLVVSQKDSLTDETLSQIMDLLWDVGEKADSHIISIKDCLRTAQFQEMWTNKLQRPRESADFMRVTRGLQNTVKSLRSWISKLKSEERRTLNLRTVIGCLRRHHEMLTAASASASKPSVAAAQVVARRALDTGTGDGERKQKDAKWGAARNASGAPAAAAMPSAAAAASATPMPSAAPAPVAAYAAAAAAPAAVKSTADRIKEISDQIQFMQGLVGGATVDRPRLIPAYRETLRLIDTAGRLEADSKASELREPLANLQMVMGLLSIEDDPQGTVSTLHDAFSTISEIGNRVFPKQPAAAPLVVHAPKKLYNADGLMRALKEFLRVVMSNENCESAKEDLWKVISPALQKVCTEYLNEKNRAGESAVLSKVEILDAGIWLEFATAMGSEQSGLSLQCIENAIMECIDYGATQVPDIDKYLEIDRKEMSAASVSIQQADTKFSRQLKEDIAGFKRDFERLKSSNAKILFLRLVIAELQTAADSFGYAQAMPLIGGSLGASAPVVAPVAAAPAPAVAQVLSNEAVFAVFGSCMSEGTFAADLPASTNPATRFANLAGFQWLAINNAMADARKVASKVMPPAFSMLCLAQVDQKAIAATEKFQGEALIRDIVGLYHSAQAIAQSDKKALCADIEDLERQLTAVSIGESAGIRRGVHLGQGMQKLAQELLTSIFTIFKDIQRVDDKSVRLIYLAILIEMMGVLKEEFQIKI